MSHGIYERDRRDKRARVQFEQGVSGYLVRRAEESLSTRSRLKSGVRLPRQKLSIPVPQSLLPQTHFPEEVLTSYKQCCTCGEKCVVNAGVVREGWWRLTRSQDQKYGKAFFCSLTCLLLAMHPINTRPI